MALFKKNPTPAAQSAGMPKKADVIIQTEREVSYKIDRLIQQSSANAGAIRGDVATVLKRCDAIAANSAKSVNDAAFTARQNTEICKKLIAENDSLKQEIKYLAKQSEGIVNQVVAENAKLKQEMQYMAAQNACVFEKMNEQLAAIAQKVNDNFAGLTANMNDQLADISKKLACTMEAIEKIDYCKIANIVATRTPAVEQVPATEVDYDRIAEIVAAQAVPATDYDKIAEVVAQAVPATDYDKIAEMVASSVPVQEVVSADYIASKVAEQILIPAPLATIDEDAFAQTVAERVRVPEFASEEEIADLVASKLVVPQPVIDFDENGLADIVAEKVFEKLLEEEEKALAEIEETDEEPVEEVEEAATIDYDELAKKVAENIPVQEPASSDEIAAKVVEQIVIPEAEEVVIDYDKIAQSVAENLGKDNDLLAALAGVIAGALLTKLAIPTVDEDKLAQAVVDKLEVVEVDEEKIANTVADKLSEGEDEVKEEAAPAAPQIDIDELADTIAKKVGALAPNDFEIVVDDAGCASISTSISDNFDYDLLASKIYTKLLESGSLDNEPDYDEVANKLAEKVTLPTINEDAIAEKAASVLSNYLPELDTDGVADKLSGIILPIIPAAPTVDTDEISDKVAEKIIENQEKAEYDIVLDDDGISRITNVVSDEVKQANDARFDKIENEIDVIKGLIIAGAVATVATEIATSDATEVVVKEEVVEEPVEEVEEPVEEIVEEAEEDIPTVSDVVEETEEAEEAEEDEDPVIEEIVDDIDEEPTEGEIMPDGIPGISNGVDFVNMMKYNRSFIARIIQGADEVKQYYGQTKNALLSYKKVNSSIAWGAERFNKGRETIARFKIRGKTLCLYLALDPAEYKKSVYHHSDVSNNKSMKGTPLMVKIKSPLGVKKAIRLIDDMLEKRNGIKQNIKERDYALMYPYQTTEELIEDGLIKDVSKK
ncbi:MAG: hypothetical protein E7370_04845 [Clostridiales bacterium]|nr:hypothetical protein [Clostridiales bacterium]